jgi:DNA-binding winged helix-turn-helix (wHTH) protein
MVFVFGDYELDTERGEIRRQGEPRHVEPQVFAVLSYLVENRDRLVSKEELLDRVWQRRFVTPATLNSRLKEARRAIGDDGKEQLAIRTIRGRGFRFVAPVTMGEPQVGGGSRTKAGELAPSIAAGDDLERARSAFARGAWREAYQGFSTIDTTAGLTAEDLERLAEAAWWLSDGTACVRARERAYRQYIQDGQDRAAASVSLALAEDYFHGLARSVGQGWLRRAERHLEALPAGREHGWMYRLKFVVALEAERKPEEAMKLAERALDTARRFGDGDLEVLALQDTGRVLVALGRVTEGMELIDEAMTAVMARRLTPRTMGRAYCNMMSTCARLGDVGRALEWYGAAYSWCEPHAESGYPGVCRVQNAGILRLRGALAQAEREATRAAAELDGFLADVAGEAFYELGEIRLRMGDLPRAEGMFNEAHARGRDPQPGMAALRLAEGRPGAACSMIERALMEPGLTMLDRAKLLPTLVEIRVTCDELDTAAEAAAELETITLTYASPALAASAALARGRVELARGQAQEAIVHLRRACRVWTQIELPLELAQTRLLLARAYSVQGNADEAELEERAARTVMDGIREGTARH